MAVLMTFFDVKAYSDAMLNDKKLFQQVKVSYQAALCIYVSCPKVCIPAASALHFLWIWSSYNPASARSQ